MAKFALCLFGINAKYTPMKYRLLIAVNVVCFSLALGFTGHAQVHGSYPLTAEEWEIIKAHRAKKSSEGAAVKKSSDEGEKKDDEATGVPRSVKILNLNFSAGYRALYGGIAEPKETDKVIGFTPSDITDYTGGWNSFIGNFRLRKEWNENKKYESKGDYWYELDTIEDAQPAEFAWVRDGLTDSDSWNAAGVIYYPIIVRHSETSMAEHPHPALILSPSVEFNRDTGTDASDDPVNSLIFRLGFDWDIPLSDDSKSDNCIILRGALGYQTDFDFESENLIAELELAPVLEKIGLNTFERPYKHLVDKDKQENLKITDKDDGRWVYRKITAKPLVTLGDVLNDGGQLGLQSLDGSFLHAGFEVGLDLKLKFLPKALNRTTIGATYRWWADVGSDSETYDYLQATINVPILSAWNNAPNAGDRVFITGFYRKGNIPVTLEEEDLLGVTLGLKF